MEIKFLKMSPPEAIENLADCINRGYDTLNKIRNDFYAHQENPNTQKAQWDSWLNEWAQDTMQKLEQIYVEPSRIHYFREKTTQRFSFDTDTALTSYQSTFDTKIEVLKGYYDFILNHSHPSVTINGNLNFQVGENIRNDQE